ncbi:hypothetical protein [Brevundimonas sp.]|nr:hypothetical protein [Brevundimonas sp.]
MKRYVPFAVILLLAIAAGLWYRATHPSTPWSEEAAKSSLGGG